MLQAGRIDWPQVFSACGMSRCGVSCACVFLGYQMRIARYALVAISISSYPPSNGRDLPSWLVPSLSLPAYIQVVGGLFQHPDVPENLTLENHTNSSYVLI